jgi:hypothetical protein
MGTRPHWPEGYADVTSVMGNVLWTCRSVEGLPVFDS